MSAILAVRGPGAAIPEARVRELLGRMAYRGADTFGSWQEGDALLAVARDEWETRPGFAGSTLVGSRGRYRVVCDATMYFVPDLVERLRVAGHPPASTAAADLIGAAYAAFGPRCVDYLEGDFAFVLWDPAERTLFCARDPFGSRSLFHATVDGSLRVASTPHPLLTGAATTDAYDPEGVLRSLLMRYGDGTRTAWKGVSELPAGHALLATPAGLELRRYWLPRGVDRWSALSSEDSAEALRSLLESVVQERGLEGSTALALSGGRDSTAVLASLRPRAGSGPDLLSFRYPAGDPGDEAWYVELVAERFGLPVHWIGIEDRPFYEDIDRRLRLRSNCHGHVFEGHNRSLARTAASLGDRVLLNGHGGDNVMAAGNWKMADLLRRGRLLALHRYRRSRGYRGRRQFVEACLRPALPVKVFDLLEPLLGRRLCSRPYERPPPKWIRREHAALATMILADRDDYARRVLRSYSSVTEQRRAWALLDCGHQRGCAASFDLNRDEGVELRMPFYDRRLVEFVMSRPVEELNQPNQYKVLLGRAMAGRLPDRSRGPLAGGFKSGTALGVVQARWGTETLEFARSMGPRPWLLEEMGLVDRGGFLQALENGDALHWWSAVDVSLTLLIEQWLRSNGSGLEALRATDSFVAADRQRDPVAP